MSAPRRVPDDGSMSASTVLQPTGVESGRPRRDPAIDLLRAAALGVVVLGHWLLTVVHWHDGSLTAHNLLDVAPITQWATWPFQVMPLFFAVGGWAAAHSWAGHADRRRSAWVAARLRRLLVPATTYLVVASLLTAVTEATLGESARAVGGLLGMHLWFLAVFVPVTAVTPLLCETVSVHGWRVPLGLATAAVAVDLAHLVVGVPGIAWSNFALVWLAFTAAGVSGAIRPPRRDQLGVVAAASFGALVAVVTVGWYPHSMVGVGDRSNNTPPTVALGLLGLTQVALAAAAVPGLRRRLERRRRNRRPRRRLIDLAGTVGIHVYLWHLVATVAVVACMATGIGNVEPLGGAWWASRPLWWAVLALVATPIVVGALAFDRRRFRRVGTSATVSTWQVVVATILATAAFAVVARRGVELDATGITAVFATIVAGRLVLGRTQQAGRRLRYR